MSITITTWNVNSLKVRQPQVLDFLKETENSILCLQELKMQEADIDAAAFKEVGYTLDAFGQKTYNGVATILRDPLTFLPDEEVRNIPGFEDPQSRLLATTVQVGSEKLRVINGYFPNGETVESEKFPYKLAWLEALVQWLPSQLEEYPNFSATLTSPRKIAMFGIRNLGRNPCFARLKPERLFSVLSISA